MPLRAGGKEQHVSNEDLHDKISRSYMFEAGCLSAGGVSKQLLDQVKERHRALQTLFQDGSWVLDFMGYGRDESILQALVGH